jgi:hypothetical protein
VLIFLNSYLRLDGVVVSEYVSQIHTTLMNVMKAETSNTVKTAVFPPWVVLLKLNLNAEEVEALDIPKMDETLRREFASSKSLPTGKPIPI